MVTCPDGALDVAMYQALQTTLTLDDALSLCEIDEVARSWRAAEKRNADKIAKIVAGGSP